MKFPIASKIEACTARDSGRYAMHGVSLQEHGGKRVLAATDGRCLAVVPVEDAEADTLGAIIPREAFAEARKLDKRKPEGAELHVNGTVTASNGATWAKVEGEFPRWSAVLPGLERVPKAVIAFNPDYLRALADALAGGAEVRHLKLYIYEPHEPIRVEGPLGYGALMPITLD